MFSELQEKYVFNFDGMSKDRLETFLKFLKNDKDAPYREDRIRRIEKRLRAINQTEQYNTERRAKWRILAEEDKAIKAEWERLGATFRANESMVTWEYEGKPFYRWFSGARVEDEIHRAREAYRMLKEMVE